MRSELNSHLEEGELWENPEQNALTSYCKTTKTGKRKNFSNCTVN
jgi:hypothetical protein